MKLLTKNYNQNHEEKLLNKKYVLSFSEMLQVRGGDDDDGMEKYPE
jgi:hypothetical protein